MTAPASQPKKTIRQLRQERAWSQRDVVERLGVHPKTVTSWERGRLLPWPRHQQALADLFGVSVEAIAFGPAEQP